MIAVGVGCRRGCPASDITALVETAIRQLPQGRRPDGLFSLADKCAEPGLVEAAARLGLPLRGLERDRLALVAGQARSCSRRVEDMFGLPGIAETAALAGAGDGATLLVPRLASARATCAIAGRLEA